MAETATELPMLAPVRLEDRYDLDEGKVFLSGVQALVRVLLDQHRADARARRRTASSRASAGWPPRTTSCIAPRSTRSSAPLRCGARSSLPRCRALATTESSG